MKRYIRSSSIVNTDSEGNLLTDAQLTYFNNSQIQSNGHLLVCYHGTQNPGFTEFNAPSGESRFGKYKFNTSNVNFFTTERSAAASYTEFGYEKDGNVYAVYVNIEHPYVVDNESLADLKNSFNIKDSKLRKQQVTAFDKIFRKWKSAWPEPEDVDNINEDLAIFNVELRPAEGNDDIFDLWFLGNNSFFGAERAVLEYYYLDELFSDDMYDELLEEVVGEDEDDYYFTTDDVVRIVLYMNKTQGTNYDGIIIDDIMDSAQMFSPSATDVITLKSSNQIKAITNESPTSSSNINK